jgi:hypothetical protein
LKFQIRDFTKFENLERFLIIFLAKSHFCAIQRIGFGKAIQNSSRKLFPRRQEKSKSKKR